MKAVNEGGVVVPSSPDAVLLAHSGESVSINHGAGGGGGAGGALGDGYGGAGISSDISGKSVTYARGGNSGTRSGENGAAGTGNGGAEHPASTSNSLGYPGGSGIVIVRLPYIP